MNVFKKFQEVFDLNESTLSGCVDIIVVEQPDQSLKSSSFHVRFGKFKVLKSNEKIVTIKINDLVQKVQMKMDSSGEAYFEDIRDENVLDKLINAGMSSDDAFSDYELPNIQSDDEGYFDKDKINEQISKNKYRFDDLISPQKEKEGKIQSTQPPVAGTIQTSNDKQAATTSAAAAAAAAEKTQQKKGFWQNIFGGRKKQDDSVSNQTSRKNSENVTIEELQSKIEKQQTSQNNGEIRQEGAQQSQNSTQPVNSDKQNGSSDIESEVDRFVINDEQQQQSQKNSKTPTQNSKTNPTNIPTIVKSDSANAKQNNGSAQNPSQKEIKEDKYKMNDVVENLEKSKVTLQQQTSLKASIDIEADKKDSLRNSQILNTSASTSEKKIEENKKDGKEYIKIEMKDIIDQKKDIKELIASKKAEKQVIQEQTQIKELNEEGNEDDEEEEDEEDEDQIGLSLCNNMQSKKGQENKTLDQLFEEYKVTYEQFSQDPLKILTDKNLLLKIGYHLYPWEIASTILVSRLAFKQEIPDNILQNMVKQQKKKSSSGFLDFFFRRNKNETPLQKPVEAEPAQSKDKVLKKDLSQLQLNQTEKNETITSPLQSPKSEEVQEQRYRKMSDEISVVSDTNSTFGKSKVRKTFKPKSDVLKSFNLKYGANKVSFTVQTSFQGEQTLEGYIYLWPSHVQIIISDIDGTITKSDVLGQLMPMFDKDWTHEGVVQLYQNLVKNGYQILYLTARAIGQSEQTRKFIYNVKQDNINLPLGPIIMSSDRLLKSFKREVIDKKPEVFKIAVLREIQQLFPNKNVYYAGFGNRETDCVAYRAVQVSIQKIYIINPASELHQINNTYKKSYPLLNEIVDQVFPPLKNGEDQIQDEFNSFNFWNIKPPAVDDISKILEE